MATTTGYIDFTELGATPSTPSSTHWRLYFKSDGIYIVDDAGSASGPFPTSALSNPMTTSQDIIVGGASGTPGRLAKGNAGGALSIVNSAVAWNSGTSFPGTVATGDRYWRTDLGMEGYYDGTRWRCTCPHSYYFGGSQTLSATASVFGPLERSFDSFVTAIDVSSFVSGTNNGSNYWDLVVNKIDSANSGTSIGTVSTSADSGSTWTTHTVAVNAVVAAATSFILRANWTKNGAPGNLTPQVLVHYNRVLT